MIDVSVVLMFLRPDAQWSLGDSYDYDSLVWLSNNSSPPSREEVETAWLDAKRWHYMRQVRINRNTLLAESDWTQVEDAPIDKTVWAEYRQALRDLPENIIDPEKPIWPTRPDEGGE